MALFAKYLQYLSDENEMGRRRSYKGKFKPRNPAKYKGDLDNIVWRSTWELKMMNALDNNPNVIHWGSEPMAIRYVSPVDNKLHRYFPDFYVYSINKGGKKTKCLIEVKPKRETQPPKTPKKVSPRFIQESRTWAVNEAKWEAATNFCKTVGWDFRIATEHELGIK